MFHQLHFVCTALMTANRTREQAKCFWDQFPDFLHLLSDGKEIIVVGDINGHFENKHNSEVCQLRSLLNDRCFKQLMNRPTPPGGHLLDWVIACDDSPMVSSLDVMNIIALSDHRTVFCKLSLQKPSCTKQQVTFWKAQMAWSYQLPDRCFPSGLIIGWVSRQWAAGAV